MFTQPPLLIRREYAYRKITGTLCFLGLPDSDGDCPRGLLGRTISVACCRQNRNNSNLYRTLYKYSLTGQEVRRLQQMQTHLIFGNTILGTNSDRVLNISNTGIKLIISNFNITNPRFFFIAFKCTDTINPWSFKKNYTLRFSPTVFGTTSGQLRITNNDGGTPVKNNFSPRKGVLFRNFIFFHQQRHLIIHQEE